MCAKLGVSRTIGFRDIVHTISAFWFTLAYRLCVIVASYKPVVTDILKESLAPCRTLFFVHCAFHATTWIFCLTDYFLVPHGKSDSVRAEVCSSRVRMILWQNFSWNLAPWPKSPFSFVECLIKWIITASLCSLYFAARSSRHTDRGQGGNCTTLQYVVCDRITLRDAISDPKYRAISRE